MEFPTIPVRTATPATEHDLEMDAYGYTSPNLHRRIESDRPIHSEEGELFQRDYHFTVNGRYSYRTIHTYNHDENSDVDELP